MALAALLILLALFLAFLVVFVVDYVKRRKSAQKFHVKESLVAYGLLLPACLFAFFLVILPIFFSLGYAFTDLHKLKPNEVSFVGFENFKTLFTQLKQKGDIYYALKNTGLFVVLVVPLQILLALLLALFCNKKGKMSTFFKICFFAPVAVSLSVTAYLWKIILSPNAGGIMNSIFAKFGVESQDFLGNEKTVMYWMIFLSAWQGCGYQMLIFLSALGNIRKDLYEAASIDGAGPFRKFFTVTLPGLKPTLVFIVITVFIGACRVMIQPMLLTGYQSRSMTLSYYMYIQGFSRNHIGYSCAVALIMTIFMGTITFIQRKLLGEKKKR